MYLHLTLKFYFCDNCLTFHNLCAGREKHKRLLQADEPTTSRHVSTHSTYWVCLPFGALLTPVASTIFITQELQWKWGAEGVRRSIPPHPMASCFKIVANFAVVKGLIVSSWQRSNCHYQNEFCNLVVPCSFVLLSMQLAYIWWILKLQVHIWVAFLWVWMRAKTSCHSYKHTDNTVLLFSIRCSQNSAWHDWHHNKSDLV